MKIIYLKTDNSEEIFNQMREDIGGCFNNGSLRLNNKIAQGSITGISFKNNIIFITYDVIFMQDTLLIHRTKSTDSICFMYCVQGTLTHSFGMKGEKRSLNQFQTGIFSSRPNKETVLFFKKNEAVKLTNIMLNTGANGLRQVENIDLIQDRLLKTFMPKNNKQTFAYIGSYNFKIANKIQELENLDEKGVVRKLLLMSIINMILAMEIQQYKEDLKKAKSNYSYLTKNEMEDIKKLSLFIKNYPEIEYSLKYLRSKTGMSPSKLQKGFKLLHNRTVADYIRNVRIEAAENLIKTTDLNITEIVYSVGLTSRSYFSKIFKEKYNCSPKNYQYHQNKFAVTA